MMSSQGETLVRIRLRQRIFVGQWHEVNAVLMVDVGLAGLMIEGGVARLLTGKHAGANDTAVVITAVATADEKR